VRPETADHLAKARHALENAGKIVQAGVPDVAAREAYLAAFHAAEAYIFERTGKAAKTHHGVRAQFARLAQYEPRISEDLVSFLRAGYQLKAVSDYGIGQAVGAISSADAEAAIAMSVSFIECVAALLQ
jgi:uncharacterized protein (UPF0332 family)